ncbi:dTDP-4-dehydrorhamnose reductase [bacterium]|nr:dTDP-4-dehydrorhamnose reductase [bacterium]
MSNAILLTGAHGMLAADVKLLKPAGIALIETDVAELDITNADAVDAFCARNRPDLVLNCAAYTAVDKAETEIELARAVNAAGPANLARVCARRGMRLVHVSTDFVFEGDGSHLLAEDDTPAPRGAYARTKREGEIAIEQAGGAWLIVRTSWLFGLRGNSFPATMLKLAHEKSAWSVVNDQTGRPTYSRDLAAALWSLIAIRAAGYVHFCNEGACTWYDFAVETVRQGKDLGLIPRDKKTVISPCATREFPRPAPRPWYSALSTAKFTGLTGAPPRPWQEALHDFLLARKNS